MYQICLLVFTKFVSLRRLSFTMPRCNYFSIQNWVRIHSGTGKWVLFTLQIGKCEHFTWIILGCNLVVTGLKQLENGQSPENLVQNRLIGIIVSARPTAAPSIGRRDKVGGIMSIWWTSPPPILRFTHCTKLPWALLPIFLFSAVQLLSPFFAVLGPIVWSPQTETWHWSSFVVPISDLFKWRIVQFFRLLVTALFHP